MEIEENIADRVRDKRNMDGVIADLKGRMDWTMEKRMRPWNQIGAVYDEDDWEAEDHFNSDEFQDTSGSEKWSGSVCYVFPVVSTATFEFDFEFDLE